MSKRALNYALPMALALAASTIFACSDDGGSDASTETSDTDAGDGDGDPGDGDGDPGDGDGDPGDGDGDPTPTLPEDFPDSLTELSGCGDVNIHAIDATATTGIFFHGSELAATAHEMGMPLERISELPSPDVDLQIVIGTALGETCSDTGDGPMIDHAWTAVSGTVTLSVTPVGMAQPWETPAEASLELTNVTFSGEGRDDVVVDSLVLADVYVGWLPG